MSHTHRDSVYRTRTTRYAYRAQRPINDAIPARQAPERTGFRLRQPEVHRSKAVHVKLRAAYLWILLGGGSVVSAALMYSIPGMPIWMPLGLVFASFGVCAFYRLFAEGVAADIEEQADNAENALAHANRILTLATDPDPIDAEFRAFIREKTEAAVNYLRERGITPVKAPSVDEQRRVTIDIPYEQFTRWHHASDLLAGALESRLGAEIRIRIAHICSRCNDVYYGVQKAVDGCPHCMPLERLTLVTPIGQAVSVPQVPAVDHWEEFWAQVAAKSGPLPRPAQVEPVMQPFQMADMGIVDEKQIHIVPESEYAAEAASSATAQPAAANELTEAKDTELADKSGTPTETAPPKPDEPETQSIAPEQTMLVAPVAGQSAAAVVEATAAALEQTPETETTAMVKAVEAPLALTEPVRTAELAEVTEVSPEPTEHEKPKQIEETKLTELLQRAPITRTETPKAEAPPTGFQVGSAVGCNGIVGRIVAVKGKFAEVRMKDSVLTVRAPLNKLKALSDEELETADTEVNESAD